MADDDTGGSGLDPHQRHARQGLPQPADMVGARAGQLEKRKPDPQPPGMVLDDHGPTMPADRVARTAPVA